MITRLAISNFKSVRGLDVECKKVNLFIGEPNTGKSNILEALGLLSWCGQDGPTPLAGYVRLETAQDLFFDQLLDQPIDIRISTPSISPTGVRVAFAGGSYELSRLEGGPAFRTLDEQGHYDGSFSFGQTRDMKLFRFNNLAKYDEKVPGSLRPPDGTNLFSVVYGSKALRDGMAEFFRRYGLKVVMKPHERVFEIQKQSGDVGVSFPYALTSDTLRRIIFYTMAIASNKESVLILEEPESNAFPYYTKYLGERIGLDQTNQFFIATHNPYLLSAVIEKARKEDVQVFITYLRDYQTLVKPLKPDQLAELMEADPFFNITRFIEEA